MLDTCIEKLHANLTKIKTKKIIDAQMMHSLFKYLLQFCEIFFKHTIFKSFQGLTGKNNNSTF